MGENTFTLDLAAICKSPLYQLNLALWATIGTDKVDVVPFLKNAGFALRFVEGELFLPQSLLTKAKAANLDTNYKAFPELLLEGQGPTGLMLECKASMFGHSSGAQPSGKVKQARLMLLQAPKVLDEVLARPALHFKATYVVYLTVFDDSNDQAEGLANIAGELKDKGFDTAAHGVLALKPAAGKICVYKVGKSSEYPTLLHKSIPADGLDVHRHLSADNHPQPLYLVPWLPDGTDGEDTLGYTIFGQRILATVAEYVGPLVPGEAIELRADDLLIKATFGLYERWRSKQTRDHLRRKVKDLVKGQLQKASLTPSSLSDGSGFEVCISDASTKELLLENLRKWRVQEDWIGAPIQKVLFAEQDGGEAVDKVP